MDNQKSAMARQVQVIDSDVLATPERQGSEPWREDIVYHVYPSSFKDGLRGITAALDHIHDDVGATAIWSSPFARSPKIDNGYDIADYCDVDPSHGNLEDFDILVKELKARGMRLYLDLVMNHTSDQHEWFQRSREGGDDNPYKDYYVWKDPKPDGSPPNNWASIFEGTPGSAWTFDSVRGQYYLRKFTKEQPDVNMRNPQVRGEMKNVITFWKERCENAGAEGVFAGVRMDVLHHIFEDPTFSDMELNPDYDPSSQWPLDQFLWREKYVQYEEVHEFAREIMDFLHQNNLIGIGEIDSGDPELVASMHIAGVDLPFNFNLLQTTNNGTFTAEGVKKIWEEYLAALPEGASPNLVLNNHDQYQRLATRIGRQRMPLAAVLELTLGNQAGGIPFIFNGDELAMEAAVAPDEIKDPQAIKMGAKWSRDPNRTEIPLHTLAQHREDPNSQLSFMKRLKNVRQQSTALRKGKYIAYDSQVPSVLTYGRQSQDQTTIIMLNFSEHGSIIPLPQDTEGGTVVLSTHNRQAMQVEKAVALGPYEACIIETTEKSIQYVGAAGD